MPEQSALHVETREESPVLHRLEVELPPERVHRAFERAYRDLGRKARIRGFRPGKVPRSVLAKMYGPALREEIERSLVAETLPEAVERSGLRPVSEPAIDAQPPEDAAPFRYSAQIEVKPRIELPELAGLPGRRPPVEVSEADVLTQLEELRERHAQLVEEPEGTPASRGHVAVVDFVGRIDGETFEGGSGRDVEVELGSDRFLPGFAEQLEGARADEDREVRVTFPEEYGKPELAGREAVFQVHVASVRRRELPELDDEFAKDLGEFDDLDALRQKVRDDLRAARERAADQELRRSVLDALSERTSFSVPPGLVERRLQARLASAHRQLEGNVPEDALHAQLDAWREQWRPRAEQEVREELLLEAVVEARGVQVDDAEVDERVEALAAEQGVDAARLRRVWQERGALDALREQIREEKALALLCAEATIDASPEA